MSNATSIEQKHHFSLSPSSSKRWLTCPGSVKLIASLNVEETPSKYAAEGTVAHEIHELCLKDSNVAQHYKGRKFESDGFKFTVNDDMIEAVQYSVDYVNERMSNAIDMGYEVEIYVEVKASLKFLKVEGMGGGTSDLVIVYKLEGVIVEIDVFDYKHGAGVPVEVEGNPQAMSYGVGIVNAMGGFDDDKSLADGVNLIISQPRAFHPDGPIREHNMSKADLISWTLDTLVPGAEATKLDNAELVPSDGGCRFCKASGNCPALYNRTQEVAMLDFDDVEGSPNMPDINSLDSEQKLFIMKHGKVITDFVTSVQNQVKLEVDSGSTDYESDYKLVRKVTRRKLKDDALDEFSLIYDHLEEDDLYERKPKAMGAIEKTLIKSIGKEAAKEVMGDLTTKPEGELVIAPLSDKRKAVQAAITTEFSDLV